MGNPDGAMIADPISLLWLGEAKETGVAQVHIPDFEGKKNVYYHTEHLVEFKIKLQMVLKANY